MFGYNLLFKSLRVSFVMKCAVCGVTDKETELFEGISIGEMIMVCKPCAKEGGIPVIKKPSLIQLEQADEHQSVRQRMERLSGMHRITPISDDGSSSQALRARLKEPPKAESNSRVVHNYHWNLTLARRRKKQTVTQVSKETGVSQQDIVSIERGKIPAHFEEIFPRLERYFGISLLTSHPKQVSFVRKHEESSEEILEAVRNKMTGTVPEIKTPPLTPVKPVKEQYSDKVTLNELIERKRARDKQLNRAKAQKQEDNLIGDDLDLDLSEV